MKEVIKGIQYWVRQLPEEYRLMSNTDISDRPAPNKWSKKEILGHLCDSAINNIQRFVKIQYEKPVYVLEPYDQEYWVRSQQHQTRPLDELLTLFQALNNQVVTIIKQIPGDKLLHLCDIGNNEHKTLQWLIEDYLSHMEHHIRNQILSPRT
ncbi:DinB family protein [Priestia koreensis]|uniref:DinB family protein n=1 Tax=Priestia koreensis TaxID=284581 RepID=UPI003D08F831